MSLTTFPHVEQRSPQWFEQRRGMVTASVVGQLLTSGPPSAIEVGCPRCGSEEGSSCVSLSRSDKAPIKVPHFERSARASTLPDVVMVADNDTSRALTAALVAERITGYVEPGYVNNDMWRGIEEEPRARDLYAEMTGVEVETVGFMVRDLDGHKLGYSPDGLIGEDGLLEVKSPRQKGHLLTVLADEAPDKHMAQMQAGLLVSGRSWCSFVSFCGGMAPYVSRVDADPDWFAAITAALFAFEKRAAEMEATYRARVEGLPVPERIDYFEEIH